MQTNYDNALEAKKFLLGQDYDSSISQIDSYITKTVIGFGQPVMLSEAPVAGVSLLNTITGFLGIALRTNYQVVGATVSTISGTLVNLDDSQEGKYPIGAQIAVMRMGRIVVKVDTVTTNVIGTKVWFRKDTNLITSSDAVDATHGVQIGILLTPVQADGTAAIQIANVQINKLF